MQALSEIGGKGLFTKELDVALLGDALAGLARQQPNDPTDLAPRRFSTVADFANFNSSRSRAWSQDQWLSGRGSQEEF